ncbi:MAG: hypothetical protein J6T48_01740 [Bacteroidales bacterium]|nr:hypothetical protein [Bacteroidales bacterium]
MEQEKIKSILKLLDDPDKRVFDEIRDIIVENFGDFSSELTKILYSGECSEIEKTRIAELAQMSISRIFLNEFQNYTAKLSPEPSLLAGTVMIEKLIDNTFDAIGFSNYLRALSRKVWIRLGENTGIETLGIIRDVFEHENIFSDSPANMMLNGIFSGENKPMHKSMLYLVLLIVCQENGINVRPILTPSKNGTEIEIGYVNMELAKTSNIPSKHGAIFAIDDKLFMKREARILVGKPLPYYKYLKWWHYSRYAEMSANKKKYPGYYYVILEKINEILKSNIKY